MAIITVSRQFGSKGDDICEALARKLGYKLVDRKVLRKRILELGCSEEMMRKFDGMKPGFWASLSRYKDEYLYYLRTAMMSEVSSGNCVVVGRGSFLILKGIESCVSVRIVEERRSRIERIAKLFESDLKEAEKAVKQADWHQLGFHKSYFNAHLSDFFLYDMTLNSGKTDIDSAVDAIAAYAAAQINEERERNGEEQLNVLTLAQNIVNMLIFTYSIEIDNLRADVDGNVVTLRGVSSLSASVQRAIDILSLELPDFKIVSKVNVVQDSMRKSF
jgi:cytidylate kinase